MTTRGDQQGDSRLTLTAERPDVRSHAERGNEGEENWSTMNFANAAGQLLEKDPSEELLRHSRPINAQDLDDFWSSFAATRLFANTL